MYTRIHHSFIKIWQQEGMSGMFRGYKATLIWTPIFHSIYFPFYEKLRLYFAQKLDMEKSEFRVVFLSWGIAGLVSSVITNPMWMIRTRMQTEVFHSQGQVNYERKYKNILGSVQRVYMEEGFLTLYTGLVASLLNISHVLVYFPIYENLKLVLK